MRPSSLQKVQNDNNQQNKQKRKNENGQQEINEEINANTLMLFYHPLFQETTKKFLSAIYQKQSNDIQIKFFQFIELNLRIQKALIDKFQVEKAIVSALNDWNRELTLLNVQQHQLDSNNIKPFDLKFHYESILEIQMGASFSITNYAKLLDNLKEHKSFLYSEYCISIEVFQKFLFDISCNWCQFYDIEIFCFFINTIFLQITKGQDFLSCQVRSLNQIQYLSQPFFKEFNQVKHVYSRYIKKNLKTNFKVWCEWNFQRLNDICQSLLIKLGRIFSEDPRIAEYQMLFKDALENFNKEIIQSAAKSQGIESPEMNSQSVAMKVDGNQNNDAYATYVKSGIRKMQFTKNRRSLSGQQRIDENLMDEDDNGSDELLDQFDQSRGLIEEDAPNKIYYPDSDNKKQPISNGQLCLNQIEKKIIQKKLKHLNKIFEKQRNEIDQDSNSLKAAYRQAEKSNSNAFKYFQKLLHFKREQQKKFLKNLPYAITSKSQSHQQELSPNRDQEKKNSNESNEMRNKQIIEDFYMSNQGKLSSNQKNQILDELTGEFDSNLRIQNLSNLSDQISSQYQGKQRFLTSSIKKKQDQKSPLSSNQSLISPQSQSSQQNQRYQSANTSRNGVQWGQTSFKGDTQRDYSQEKLQMKSNNFDNSDQILPLDLHQIALSKAHQISPSRQRDNVYDSNSLNSSYKIHTNPHNLNSQQNKILQHSRLQPMPLVSPKTTSDSQFNNQNSSNISRNNSNQNLYHTTINFSNNSSFNQNYGQNMNSEVEKRQLTESKLYTTNSEFDQYTMQTNQQTRNVRIHSEQDHLFRNTSHDSKQTYNLFSKSLFNSSKNKKKIGLGDIINLNYLYKPNLTFSGVSSTKQKTKESQELSIDIKPLRPETTQLQNKVVQSSDRKNSVGQKVRSQTVGLNEVYPQGQQQQPTKQNSNFRQFTVSKEKNSDVKIDNNNIYLKPIQAQFTTKYRKLVSQSRYLWQKYLVEDDLYQINDYDKLNSFFDDLKNTKSHDQIKQIIQKYTNNPNVSIESQQHTERSIYQFKIPFNRKTDIPNLQGKNMKIITKI